MKKTMLQVLIILVLMAYIPSVNAGLAGSTVLSVSLANYDPNPAIAGETVDVRIGIQNTGGTTTKDLLMEVIPAYPFELVPGENAVKDVGIVQEYRSDSTQNIKVIKYTMKINKDAPAGSYELKVRYYEQGSTDVMQKSLYLDVKSRENAEVIQIDKSTLVPGKQTSLKFTINNMGNSPLRDLTFYWENEDNVILPVGSDNTKYIKYIDIGNSSDIEYQVIADTNANAGLYKLNLYLTYDDSIANKTKKISTIAGVYVGGERILILPSQRVQVARLLSAWPISEAILHTQYQ
ncbi:MAG TPA: COG1361 S-layer family protein [Candidatus Methanoperedens sp.]